MSCEWRRACAFLSSADGVWTSQHRSMLARRRSNSGCNGAGDGLSHAVEAQQLHSNGSGSGSGSGVEEGHGHLSAHAHVHAHAGLLQRQASTHVPLRMFYWRYEKFFALPGTEGM
jgi:hypothetical protein